MVSVSLIGLLQHRMTTAVKQEFVKQALFPDRARSTLQSTC